MGAGEGLRNLIERHCQTLRGNTATIRELLDQVWAGGPGRAAAARQAADLAHQMAGAGGSIGFRPVSVAARALEERLKGMIALPGNAADRAEIVRRFDALAGIVAALQPEKSTLYDVDLHQIGAARPG